MMTQGLLWDSARLALAIHYAPTNPAGLLEPYDASNLTCTPFPNTEESMHMLSDPPEYR